MPQYDVTPGATQEAIEMLLSGTDNLDTKPHRVLRPCRDRNNGSFICYHVIVDGQDWGTVLPNPTGRGALYPGTWSQGSTDHRIRMERFPSAALAAEALIARRAG
jgi:hypothetical protein